MEELVLRFEAVLLVALRIVPTLAFAAPFTLLRLPVTIRVFVGLALALSIVAGREEQIVAPLATGSSLLSLVAGELVVGMAFALALQLAFGAILWAGRAIDVQAGFGLAAVADPTTQAQMPLVGTVFAYAAAALFFTLGGMHDLLALWASSFDYLPLGGSGRVIDVAALTSAMGAAFLIAVGLYGLVMMVIFLIDLTIAFMSRTLPQMNVLLLGFQVKSMALLATLPLAIALSGAVLLRLLRLAIDSAPRLITAGGI